MVDFKKKLEEAKKLKPESKPDMAGRIKKAIAGKPKGQTLTSAPLAPPQVSEAHQEALVLLDNIKTGVTVVMNIQTEDQYLQADAYLGKIREAKDRWTGKIDPIIEPIYKGLNALYALKRDIIVPLESLEKRVKGAMVDYKRLEQQKLREEERIRQEELDRLAKQAQELEEKARTAATPQMRGRFARQVQETVKVAEQVQEVQGTQPVQAEHSHARTKMTWKIDNMQEFLRGITMGIVPWDVIASVNFSHPRMNAYYKDDPATVSQWPGIVEIDDVKIAHGKGGGYQHQQ